MASEKTNPLKRLLDFVNLDKKDVSAIYFYAILSGLIQLSLPVGVQAIIGFILGASMVTSIYILIFIVVVGVLVVGIMQINQMKIIEKIQQKIFTRYAFEFTEKIPMLDLRHADTYYLPEKVNLFFDTVTLQKGIAKILLDIPIASIQIIFGLLLLSFYHPVFIAFGLILLLILWGILNFTSKKGWSTSLLESNYKYEVIAWLEEIARVIKSFKFTQGTHLNLKKTDKNVVNYLNARTEHFKVLMLQYKVLVFFKVAITTVMLTVGTFLLLNQSLNIGEFIAAEIVILSIIGAIEKLIGSLDNSYDVITSLEKLASVTEMPLERDGSLILETPNNGLSIKAINLNFNYLDKTQALENINLEINANSKIAISGGEGSGKSSLLRVLSSNYSDFTGTLLINGIPINNYQLTSLRSQIGVYISQQGIFKGTVWENITLNRANIEPEKIAKLAQKLGIENYINSLKKGFDTDIDVAGKTLSSSLINKLLLLRAFIHSPKLLLLEEPWINLEKKEKNAVINYLLNLTPNTTVIVASNDEDFIKACDYQIIMTNGLASINQIN